MKKMTEAGKGDSTGRKITELIEDFGVVSISAAVVKGNSTIWHGSYGWHDLEAKKLIQDDSIIRVASISKSFTALAIMQLVQRGLLDLEEDVNNYLELKVKIRNPAFPDRPVTVKQLLNHTSSLTDGNYVQFCREGIKAAEKSQPLPTLNDYFNEDGLFYSPQNWADYGPGKEFAYSNMGYVVLGAIVEKVSGMRFDRYAKEYILNPLEMKSSSFNINDLDYNRVSPMYRRVSDEPSFKKTVLKPLPEFEDYVPGTHGGLFGPQGGLLSCAIDLSHFVIAMSSGGTYKGKSVLAPSLVDEMHRISVRINKEGEEGYFGLYKKKGLGIHITDKFIEGRRMYGHPGGAYGIITALYYTMNERENFGIIFLINGSNLEISGARSAFHKIEEDLADLLYNSFI